MLDFSKCFSANGVIPTLSSVRNKKLAELVPNKIELATFLAKWAIYNESLSFDEVGGASHLEFTEKTDFLSRILFN